MRVSLTFFAVVLEALEAPGWEGLVGVGVVVGAVEVEGGVCDVISKGSCFGGERSSVPHRW